MHKSATKCNETIGKWCKNKHGASKIIDTFETYHLAKHLHIAHCINDHNLDFVAISETDRRYFSQRLLDRFSGGVNFEWTSQPPRGKSGGILLGVWSNTMEVLAHSGGDYHIKLHIRNIVDNFTWSLVTVYGAA
jgi:hypothetical protein